MRWGVTDGIVWTVHPAFPSPDAADAEDVAWGLTTGAALWKQGERYDAIVWLKRAVDAASEAGLSTRADELNRAATELLASLSGRVAPTPSAAPPPVPPPAPLPAARRAPPPPPPAQQGASPRAGLPLPPLKPPPIRARAAPPPPPATRAPPAPASPPQRQREARHFPPLPAGPPPRTPLPARPRLVVDDDDDERMYPSPLPAEDPEARPNPAIIDAAIREALSQPPIPIISFDDAITTEVPDDALHESLEDITLRAVRGFPAVQAAPSAMPHPVHLQTPAPESKPKREPFQTEVDEETELDETEVDETQVLKTHTLEAEVDVNESEADETLVVKGYAHETEGNQTDPNVDEADSDLEETIPLHSLRVVLDSRPPATDKPSLAPIRSVPISMSAAPNRNPSHMPPAPPATSVAPGRSSALPGPMSDLSSSLAHARANLPSGPAVTPPASNASVRASQPSVAWGSSPIAPFRQSPLPPLPPSVAPPPILLDALGQLSPAHREALLNAATIESLGVEEEVTVSGLAFVITGQASIQATIAEASAGALNTGELLYAKSPIAETVSLRLVAESEQTQIALWDAKTAEEALSASPELLERLRIASARVQAIVGCSMGAMGERLDESLRSLAIERLETRILQPREVLASAGLPVPGMVIVGVGSIELDDDGSENAADPLLAGDFLFATEVLGGEAAPATARAGAKGAIVLFGGRAVAHELLMTCPPLLEIFAGM